MTNMRKENKLDWVREQLISYRDFVQMKKNKKGFANLLNQYAQHSLLCQSEKLNQTFGLEL